MKALGIAAGTGRGPDQPAARSAGLARLVRIAYRWATDLFWLAAKDALVAAARFGFWTLVRRRGDQPITVDGVRLVLRTSTTDLTVARSCFTGEFDLLTSLEVPPGGVIVDASAYIGTASIVFARAFPEARIIAVEPSRDNARVLRGNVRTFPNITVVEAALGPHPGTTHLHDRHSGAWGYSTMSDAADGRHLDVMHEVAVTSILEIMEQANVGEIEILKLDIEGPNGRFSGRRNPGSVASRCCSSSSMIASPRVVHAPTSVPPKGGAKWCAPARSTCPFSTLCHESRPPDVGA